jgi:hypothetical protein
VGRHSHHVETGRALDGKTAARPAIYLPGEETLILSRSMIMSFTIFTGRRAHPPKLLRNGATANALGRKYKTHPLRLLIAGVADDENLMNSQASFETTMRG